MKTCEEFAEDVTAYLERGLPRAERLHMWVHQMMCASCRTYVKQIQLVRKTAAKLKPTSEIDSDQLDTLTEAFREHHS